MIKHNFAVQPRTITGRSVKHLRLTGLVPANIFGKKVASLAVQMNSKDFDKLRRSVGESTLLYLQVDGESTERPVLVRELIYHPVSHQLLHVSFNQVSLKEKVTAPVAVLLEGTSPAESEKLGILVQQLDEVEVEALPTDMPEGLKVDVSVLTEVGASIAVKDLSVDTSKITIITDPEAILVKIEPLAAEEKNEVPAPPVAPEADIPAAPTSETPAPASPEPAKAK